MKIYYLMLALSVFMCVSLGIIGPTGISANSNEIVIITGVYLFCIVPYVFYRGVKLFVKELKKKVVKENGNEEG